MMMQGAIHDTYAQRFQSVRHRAAPVGSQNVADPIEMMGVSMPFARNVEIYGESEPAEYVYKIISGTVRTHRVLADGRRQIGAFYLPGDVFGLESCDEHSFSAEAVTNSNVLVIKRSSLLALAARDNDVARKLWALTSSELHRLQKHTMALIKTAQERVVDFLLEMAARVPAGNQVELPMSRQDIADYLGLTIETVSRTLTHLENTATIDLPNSRCVVLRNRSALGRLAA